MRVTTPLDLGQPIVVRNKPVTFWRLIKDSGKPAGLANLARTLRKLHHLSVPARLDLPIWDMFGRVGARIDAVTDIPADVTCFLRQRLSQLIIEYNKLTYDLTPCAIHGDAHDENLMVTPSGDTVMIDLERFAFGPPEADLTVTATEYLVGWHSAAEYHEFSRIYGFDVMSWPGFDVMRRINELKMTSWLMQNVAEDDAIAVEFQNRLTSLHDDDAPRRWEPF
jgi:thiamine kinase-like enzyme